MEKFVSLRVLVLCVLFSGYVECQRSTVVNIGAIFTFNSVIGRASKAAMEVAVSDINADPKILTGTELKLIMVDADCNVVRGSMAVFQALEQRVVSVIGPQSSAVAHMMSQIANGLQVPLVSYAATDPTLSSLQYPFFVRTTQSDSYQMAAIADLVDFYGWKEVIAIFVDDDYGRNGISALALELEKKRAKIAYKLSLPGQFDLHNITDLLNESKSLGPRVYVVHVNPDPELRIFAVARKLQMLTSDYVWFATDWLSTTIDTISPMNKMSLQVVQGVVALRQHTPDSIQKGTFLSKWKKMCQKGLVSSELNTYALYAYDTVWAVAKSIDEFMRGKNNVTFSLNPKLAEMKETETQLGKLEIFNGGSLLLEKFLQTNFSGLTGQVQFNPERNIVGNGYEVINMDGENIQRVGYWSNYSGLSVLPPESPKKGRDSHSHSQKLDKVIWPSGKSERPRGWVIASNERPLRIGVPKRASFVDFVTESQNSHKIGGYCIDVFNEARKLVPYDVPYRFEPFGDGHSNPSYDDLVKMVANNVFDAAVGDIAIVTNRTKIVDFSQPYVVTGLVIVAPVRNPNSGAWVFLKPFSWEMWCATASSFILIAIVIWILEHRVNDDFRGSPKRQFVTMFMFSLSTLFKRNQEATISPLGKMVMVVWLFLLLVITSSYTASLTSILTIQRLQSPITGIDSLISSNVPIGYQVGSFAYSYLTGSLFIPRSRLIPLGSPQEYEKALRQGPGGRGVAAIVDELPYVELFLKDQTDFGIIGPPFTKSGWGFAFQRDSPLAIDMSTAILQLSENGQLQKIRENWFCKLDCPGEKGRNSDPNQLQFISFWGLYVLCGVFSLIALLLFLWRIIFQFVRYKRQQIKSSNASSSSSSNVHCSQSIYHFLDFIDEKEEAIKKIFKHRENLQISEQQVG